MTDQPSPVVSPTAPGTSCRGRGVDVGLSVVTILFAFLAASFAARNSDLWLHLATGRLLAAGQYAFGVDPFAYTTEGVYWANHAWLFDLLLYQTYHALGGTALVVAKAVGVAATAGVILRVGYHRPGPVWVAAGCTLLAVLAMSPRLLLQPACLSLLFLAVCLYLLRAGGRGHFAVPGVIALWVNLDGWFVLGPVLVALFRLAGWITPAGKDAGRAGPDAPNLSPWLLPACVAACLLSPHHVRGLTLPPELSPAVWTSDLSDDPRFGGVFVSPWHWKPLGAAGGYSPAAWAYFALLGLGTCSFAVNRRAILGWRGVIWVAFAGLSAWQTRLAPFFAVVAGPITALNFQEVLPPGALRRGGRAVVLLTGLALLVLAWPGWLQGFHARDRAIRWRVEADPSLVRAAEFLIRCREEHVRPADARIFTTHPDVANYLAWFAPGEKGFLDSRFQLFTGVAAEYRSHSLSLGLISGRPSDANTAAPTPDRRIVGAVLYDPDPRRLTNGLREVRKPGARWRTARVDGSLVWVVSEAAGVTGPLGAVFDPDVMAFGPSREDAPPPAPTGGPAALPEPAPWWDLAANRQREHSWEGDAAGVYLRMFEVGDGTSLRPDPDRSPALPLLAVRAARGAVAHCPEGDDAWFTLARAYLLLGRGTWEAGAGAGLTPLGYLRHTQTTAALFQAVTAYPDSPTTHEALAGVFADHLFLDLSLRHRRAQLRLARRAGPYPGESPEAHAERLNRLAELTGQVEYAVQDAENRFVVRTQALAGDPLARARIALGLGLAGKALDTLLQSHPDLYGTDGLRLLLDLLLQTGQVAEARVLLDRDELRSHPDAIGVYEIPGGTKDGRGWGYRFPAYTWFDFAQCAAAGRYDRAAESLDRMRDGLLREETVLGRGLPIALTRQLTFESGLGAPPGSLLSRLHVGREKGQLADRVAQTQFLAAVRADLHTLGGILHLERGDTAEAAAEFARALSLYDRARDGAPALPGGPLAGRYFSAVRKYAR
ncbi:MAG: hypothetical protein JWO38_3521 [Gemmataceae bacterium]|nr:hypothetical protein [Gemmataceae bacterium]